MNITDSTDVLGVGQQIVPWISLIVAAASAMLSLQSYKMAKQQAIEKLRNINIISEDLYFSRTSGVMRYFLVCSIVNKSSSSNSIVKIEQSLIVIIASGHEVRIKIPVAGNETPIKLDGFQAVIKTFEFQARSGLIPEGARIDRYLFEFTDSGGQVYRINPTLISEKREENVSEENSDD